jgi:hypothetical protein
MMGSLRMQAGEQDSKEMAMTVYWAAQFLVAAELERRGYFVSFTHENTPDFDLSVTSPTGEHFVVDVEGLDSSTSWLGKGKAERHLWRK